jgi:hypothetical protein
MISTRLANDLLLRLSQQRGTSSLQTSGAQDETVNLALPLEDSPYLLNEHGPIFVVGCPRSGTTFLEDSLAGMPQIEAFTGVLTSPRLAHLIAYDASQGRDVETLLLIMRDAFWQAFWRRVFFASERVGEIITGRKPIRHLHRPTHLNGLYFCYKEPFLCFPIKQLCAHFPNSKILHIVRDGRDCADSLERTYPEALSDLVLKDPRLAENKNSEIGIYRRWNEYFLPWWLQAGEESAFVKCSAFGRYVWMWQEMVTRVTSCGPHLGSTRYLELTYEALVADSNQHGQRISAFLGLNDSKRLLKRLSRARLNSVGINKRRQTSDRIAEASQIAGPLLQRYGYVT